jgi:hypothetical protein
MLSNNEIRAEFSMKAPGMVLIARAAGPEAHGFQRAFLSATFSAPGGPTPGEVACQQDGDGAVSRSCAPEEQLFVTQQDAQVSTQRISNEGGMK